MGMQASLTLISPKAYAALVKDHDADVSLDGVSYDIDKAWTDFHEAFSQLGGTLKYAIEGKHRPYGGFEENDDGMADGFVSAAVVARIAEELAKVPFKQLFSLIADRYRKLNLDFPDGEEAYLRAHFVTLKKPTRRRRKRTWPSTLGFAEYRSRSVAAPRNLVQPVAVKSC